MSLFETPRATEPTGAKGEAASTAALDAVLTAQIVVDWGREDRLTSAPPPTEPDVQISRIRLSG